MPLYANMPPIPPSPTLSLESRTAATEEQKKKKKECTYTTYLRRFPDQPRILEQGQIIKGRGTRRHVRIIGAARASDEASGAGSTSAGVPGAGAGASAGFAVAEAVERTSTG